MPLFLYVIGRDERDLYERLQAEFAGQDEEVGVVLDRRRGQRRRENRSPVVDLRRADRRAHPEIELQNTGLFVVALPGLPSLGLSSRRP